MVELIQTLLPYVVLFYVLDCFIYLKKYQIALTSHFGKKYCFKKPGLRFLGLSPFCKVFLTMTRPFFFSQDGVFIWNKSELSDYGLYDLSSFYHVFFEEIKSVESDGTRLTINHEMSIDVYSSWVANSLAERILFLKKTPSTKRLDEINSILESDSNLEQIRNVTSESFNLLFVLQLLSALLFAYTFALIPAGLYFEQTFYLKFLIISMASVYFLIILLSYWQLQNRFSLSTDSVGLLVHLLLFPVSTIHATQNFTRHARPVSDFVAISAVLLRRNDFRTVLRKELKRIHYSRMRCHDNEFAGCLKLKEEYLHRFLPIAGLAVDDVFEQPRRQDINAAVYCPFCEVEFVEGIKVCPDCNMNLIAYKHEQQQFN